MARFRRSDDWGFPRWRDYGAARAAQSVALCDRHGCDQPGTCPAPKAPNSREKWLFCTAHAAEYNAGWDYFAALDAAGAAAQEESETREARGYGSAKHWGWGEGDGSRSRAELDALRLFDLPTDADADAIKAAHRRMAKANHPDLNPGNAAAAERFQASQAAYEILLAAEARRA
ncbi:DnaJ domain-containing protein [Sandaracinobacteroides saxicola]|uniref:DnaJ domain-containing protein n=1 Tax=Sandaracinobacteroides saxicola TaxID=2759707 RepID=A0A7G5IJ78_9SPHN|nr:DnaJ domain-containing protein [Sandaracinobacteroides saxicola]QMW23420.1 DnaJ domain-containing protein [Sandaracinobacteroides saxicola]